MPSPVSTAAFCADGSVLVIASGAENLETAGSETHDVLLHVKYVVDEARPKSKSDK